MFATQTEWKLTPAEKRQPPTIRKLADKLGVSKSTVEYHLGRAPDGLSELMQAAESDELRGRYPNILKILGKLAESGDIDGIRVYLKELAGPHHAQPKAKPPLDNRLQVAIQNLVLNKPTAPSPENETPAQPPAPIEAMDGLPESTLRQIEELREIQRIRS